MKKFGVIKTDIISGILKKNLEGDKLNLGDAKVDLAGIAKKLFQNRSKKKS